MVILNGHEYVTNQATRQGVRFTEEGNCFTDWDNAAEPNRVADTLRQHSAIGRLEKILRRWLSQCFCLALDVAEQKNIHCQHAFSIYQLYCSRHLLALLALEGGVTQYGLFRQGLAPRKVQEAVLLHLRAKAKRTRSSVPIDMMHLEPALRHMLGRAGELAGRDRAGRIGEAHILAWPAGPTGAPRSAGRSAKNSAERLPARVLQPRRRDSPVPHAHPGRLHDGRRSLPPPLLRQTRARAANRGHSRPGRERCDWSLLRRAQ